MVEQVHRIVAEINKTFETKTYCSAVFLDVAQAFDKVWHTGLFYKLKTNLPTNHYTILKSYIENRNYLVKQQDAKSDLCAIKAGVQKRSVLGPVLYLLFTIDLPAISGTMIATFADDTAVFAVHENPIKASEILQTSLNTMQAWLQKWLIKVNENKSVHVTFTTRRDTCPSVILNNIYIPQKDDVKYLGVHLNRRLNWKKHIFTKRKQLEMQLYKMYWLISRGSQLNVENKLLFYKTIIKPIWSYRIQLWGTAANPNIEILQISIQNP